jgi:DNA-binding MarR family transcriptional regulator
VPKTATRSLEPTTGPSELELLATDLRLVISRLARRLRQQVEEGVTASSLSALWSIERLAPVTLGELATVERVQPPTITRIVAGLEEAGLVARQVDPSDRRVARLRLTPQGRRFVERTRTRRTAYLAKALQDVEPEDREVLVRAARILEGMLGEKQ